MQNDVLKFDTDRINVFSINPDSSSSMEGFIPAMREGLKMYKKSFLNFSEAKSMAISVNLFDDSYHSRPFLGVEDFDISYYASGCTALYESIIEGGKNLLKYIKKVAKVNGCLPRATYITLSDGESTNEDHRYYNEEKAKSVIKQMNDENITTVFVAFGIGISSEFGKQMGYKSTIDIRDTSKLISFMGEELSKSCKEQSKSMKSLGSAFFSKANDSKSAEYSSNTSDVLENDDWFL